MLTGECFWLESVKRNHWGWAYLSLIGAHIRTTPSSFFPVLECCIFAGLEQQRWWPIFRLLSLCTMNSTKHLPCGNSFIYHKNLWIVLLFQMKKKKKHRELNFPKMAPGLIKQCEARTQIMLVKRLLLKMMPYFYLENTHRQGCIFTLSETLGDNYIGGSHRKGEWRHCLCFPAMRQHLLSSLLAGVAHCVSEVRAVSSWKLGGATLKLWCQQMERQRKAKYFEWFQAYTAQWS